jgi:4-hydroxy-tetrahydrodipicolinate reductase
MISMMRALLVGYGKMGQLIANLAPQYDIAISGIVSNNLPDACVGYASITKEAIESCDIVIDFSSARDILHRIELLASAKKPIVVGTTGWEKQEHEAKKIIQQHHGALLYAPNFSLGVALFARLVAYAGELFSVFPQYDVGMMEIHHRQKQDAPSGTAIALSSMVMKHYQERELVTDLPKAKRLEPKEVHQASLRSGFHPGTHEILFDSQEDTITLSHRARNREGFARGALEASYWLVDKKGWYTLEDMIEEKLTTKRAK